MGIWNEPNLPNVGQAEILDAITAVGMDLHQKEQAARRRHVTPGFDPARVHKLLEWQLIGTGQIRVKIDNHMKQETLIGEIPDTPENRRVLADLKAREDVLPTSLRMAGYEV